MQYKKWTIKLILIFSIAVVLIFTLLYILKIIMFSYSDRMPNIRKVNKEYRLNVIQDYIEFKFEQGRTYDIVIGDSQLYGFKQYEQDTFAYLLKKRLPNIINLSIVDATEKDLVLILKVLKEKKVRINRIIYNFNLSHFSTIIQEDKIPKENLVTLNNLYMIKLLEDYWMQFIKQIVFNKKKSQQYDSRKYDEKRYDIIKANNKNFEYLIVTMQNISKKILVIFSPHSIDSLHRSGYDIREFKKNIEKYKDLLSKTNCNIIDLTFDFRKEYFLDILHLSIKGHQAMAHSILKQHKKER